MKKQYFLLVLVIIIAFLGGVFTGGLLSAKKTPNTPNSINITDNQIVSDTKIVEQHPEEESSKDNVLIGYVQDFRDPSEVDLSKLTHIIFSFAHPTADGGILLNKEYALPNLRAIVAKAKETNTKVMLAVGGWFHINGEESYDYFHAAISNPTSRTRLVSELVSIVDREGLDGIDIDFEHPRSLADAKYLAEFTKAMSDQLHPLGKELSIAVHSKINAVTLSETDYVTYEPVTFEYVDHVNIMAYDGQWDGGYHAENLSTYLFSEKIANYWSNLFEQNNISKEKLVLGVPLYAQPEDPSIKQVSYATIINDNSENAMNDTVSLNGTTYHYNGCETMKKKTILALEEGFGGMMMWETGHDTTGPYSLTTVIYDQLNLKK